MKALEPGERWRIVHTYQRLGSIKGTAKELGLSPSVVSRWIKRWYSEGEPRPAARPGRKRLVSQDAARKAKELLLSSECHGGKDLARTLHSLGLTAKQVHASTAIRAAVRQAWKDKDPIQARRGKPAKQLTAKTKASRLAFAQANKTRAWRGVMFTDRKKFLFLHPGCKVRPVTWVRKGEGRQVYTVNHAPGVNIYAGITPHGVTACHVVTGTSKHQSHYTNKKGQPAKNITAGEYRVVMCDTLLPEGRRLMGKGGLTAWVFQQDNDPTHKEASSTVQQYNKAQGTTISVLPNWPPNSPDLNPIENVWGYVQRRVQARGCTTFEEFQQAVLDEMAAVPQSMLDNLYASMPKRMAAVISKGGGKTKY